MLVGVGGGDKVEGDGMIAWDGAGAAAGLEFGVEAGLEFGATAGAGLECVVAAAEVKEL